jgi:predicted Zn-dependent protease
MKILRVALSLLSLLMLTSIAAQRQSVALAQTSAKTAKPHASSFEQLSQAAERARNESRDNEAIQLYQQALVLRPTWPEGLWYLSTTLYEKERYAEARDVLRRFLTHDSAAGPAWALLGMSEFQTREYPRALDHLERAMSLGLGDRKDMAQSVFYFVAVLRTRFERYDDSTNFLLAMVKSGTQPDMLVEPIGLAALRLPLLPTEIPPDKHEMVQMAGRGALAVEAQKGDDADKLLGEMVKKYPDEPGVHFLYGAFLLDVRPEEGIAEMKRELENSPSNAAARLRLAEEYLKEQKLDQALSLAQEAVKLEPKHSTAHLMLGEVLVAKEDLADGIRELELAEKESPQTVRTKWDLLRAYAATGRKDDAQREKEEIEKLNGPGNGR